MQVKCGKQIRLKKNGKASCKFKVDHLRYWNRLPVPVLAFYVPSNYPLKTPDYIFATDISEYIMALGLPAGNYKVIESNMKIDPESDEWQNAFLSRLNTTASLLKLREDGIISSIPELKQNYVLRFRNFPGISKYAKKSLHTIRLTVSQLVIDAAVLKYEKAIDPPNNYFDILIDILKIFEPDGRPEIMKALSHWMVIVEGKTDKTKDMVDIAIKSINGDPNLNVSTRANWHREFDPISKIINDIETKREQQD